MKSNNQRGFIYLDKIEEFIAARKEEAARAATIFVSSDEQACQHNAAIGALVLLNSLQAWAYDEANAVLNQED